MAMRLPVSVFSEAFTAVEQVNAAFESMGNLTTITTQPMNDEEQKMLALFTDEINTKLDVGYRVVVRVCSEMLVMVKRINAEYKKVFDKCKTFDFDPGTRLLEVSIDDGQTKLEEPSASDSASGSPIPSPVITGKKNQGHDDMRSPSSLHSELESSSRQTTKRVVRSPGSDGKQTARKLVFPSPSKVVSVNREAILDTIVELDSEKLIEFLRFVGNSTYNRSSTTKKWAIKVLRDTEAFRDQASRLRRLIRRITKNERKALVTGFNVNWLRYHASLHMKDPLKLSP